MKVFKFGGASVKDAGAVKNVAKILELYRHENLVVIASAMGKTTNALEKVVNSWFYKEGNASDELEKIRSFHQEIMLELFPEKTHPVYTDVNNSFVEIEWVIEDEPQRSYDFEYDQIVSIGEMLSTKILSHYLTSMKLKNKWLDVRDFLKTDNTYREAKVDWELTGKLIEKQLLPNYQAEQEGVITITQGFVGVTSENFTTTLGREGSDFTAAIIAYFTNAQSVTIWKDVPGVLNADPKWFDNTKRLNHISYLEAIELAYYGATVIHPKTIKPLQNKHIPLYVRSFLNYKEEGTLIDGNTTSDSLIPSFIFKINQVLISIKPRDFSFIVEHNLRDIYSLFSDHNIRIHLMQNSAVSFSVVVDNNPQKLPEVIAALRKEYEVLYNENLELVTIRHYDQPTLDRVTENKNILLEQKSRHTARLVVKEKQLNSNSLL